MGTSAFPTEGWGLTHANNRLYWSDGSDKIYSINAHEGGEVAHISVTLGGRPLQRLNELEWVDGELWANVWQTDTIVRINPVSGVVVGVIDLTGLLARHERQSDTDVLNGIAYDAVNKAVWVTGKRWPWLYKIGLEKQ
jgi:glutamine cyclotransferase